MPNTYSLPSRKARICRAAGAVFLLIAALTAAGSLSWLLGAAPTIYLDESGFRWRSEPLTLLDEEDRAIVAASPENGRRFADHVRRPHTRLVLAGIVQLRFLPFAGLVLGIGLALRRLGGLDDPLARALPWLRRASIAAILWALSMPLVDSLVGTTRMHGLPNDDYQFYFMINDLGEVGNGLMLAIAAYCTIWAVESGLRAQRDVAEIV